MEAAQAAVNVDPHEVVAMNCTRDEFLWAASQNIITVDQATTLWDALQQRGRGNSKFDFVHLLYYAGAIVCILAMGWFLGRNWEAFGPTGVFCVGSIYGLLFVTAGRHLWRTDDLKIPGGLLITLAVCMVPLLSYSVIDMMGFWKLEGGALHSFWWTVVHSTTALAALIALRFVRFPFLMAPLSFALWSIVTTMPWMWYIDSFESRAQISIFYGFIMLVVAYGIDLHRSNNRDFAFWLYLFGGLSMFTGMEILAKGEFTEFLFFLGYVAMMLFSVLLQRKALMVFGALGTIGYLFHVSWTIFHDSPLFPLVLVFCGLSTITCGVIVQKNREQLRGTVLGAIPPSWREYLPQRL